MIEATTSQSYPRALNGKIASCFDGIGGAVAGCGMETPVLERCEALVIDLGTQALENRFSRDLATLIDGYLDHLVAGTGWQLPGIDHGIGSRDGESRADLIAV